MEILWIVIGIAVIIYMAAKENAFALGYGIGTFLRIMLPCSIIGFMGYITKELRYSGYDESANILIFITIIASIVYIIFRIKDLDKPYELTDADKKRLDKIAAKIKSKQEKDIQYLTNQFKKYNYPIDEYLIDELAKKSDVNKDVGLLASHATTRLSIDIEHSISELSIQKYGSAPSFAKINILCDILKMPRSDLPSFTDITRNNLDYYIVNAFIYTIVRRRGYPPALGITCYDVYPDSARVRAKVEHYREYLNNHLDKYHTDEIFMEKFFNEWCKNKKWPDIEQ